MLWKTSLPRCFLDRYLSIHTRNVLSRLTFLLRRAAEITSQGGGTYAHARKYFDFEYHLENILIQTSASEAISVCFIFQNTGFELVWEHWNIPWVHVFTSLCKTVLSPTMPVLLYWMEIPLNYHGAQNWTI